MRKCLCCGAIILMPSQHKLLVAVEKAWFVTSRSMAEELGVKCIESMSGRLKKLWKAGLLHRRMRGHNAYQYYPTKKGREYIQIYKDNNLKRV